MEEENKNRLPLEDEKVLDFEVAKDLTIAEAMRKHKEIEAGVTEYDGLLDRYIKQHRDEIESQKFETKVNHLPMVELFGDENIDTVQIANLSKTLPDEFFVSSQDVTEFVEKTPASPIESLEETMVAGAVAVDSITNSPLVQEMEVDEEDDLGQTEEVEKDRKQIIYFWSALVALFVVILATAFVWLNSVNKSTTGTPSSSSSSQSSTTASRSAFEQLYSSFFTDSSLTKLKNSEFGKLAELKSLLDKMDQNSESYKKAKEQYVKLEKAIAAIQTMNGQFDKEVIVNGEIDTTATAKADASLTATNTGISSVDSLLASVVNFGRSQQEVAAGSAVTTEATADSTQVASTETGASTSTEVTVASDASTSVVTGSSTSYGIPVPAGVTLQRDRSRVPYDQAKIDDVNNEAWVFTPGILENIVAVSQQRGYITGNQYILEKVNIINGNGYYNMFKPDGTYLFSINCKTGYFVGNGAGHSDVLDY